MKKLLLFLPTHFTCCLIIGILIEFQYKLQLFATVNAFFFFSLFLIVLFVLNRFKKRQLFTITSWVLFVFIGMFTVYFQDETTSKKYYSNFSVQDSLVVLQVDKVLKSNLYNDKFIGHLKKIGASNAVGTLLVNIQKDTLREKIKVDDVLYFKTQLILIEAPKNPYQFNYKAYLEKQGIYHQVFLKNATFLQKEASKKRIYSLAASLRDRIEASLKKYHFKGDELAVIKALILGQRSGVSSQLLQDYTKAGAIHILAVSGLHVGIILLLLSTLFKPLEKLPYGALFKTILIIILMWCFAVIAGLSASVVRAVTMFTFVAVGLAFKRKTFVLHSLISSMFFLLLVKPLFVFDVGFQLSYLAVFSIVTIQPKLTQLWKPKWKIIDKFWQLFTVSLAAQIGVLPISLFYFHQFPGLFMVSNLVIIPCIGIILMGGILVIILALLQILPAFLAEIYNAVISLMNQFVAWISLQESFLIQDISFSFKLLIASYICFFSLVYLLEKASFKKWVYFLISILVFQLCLLLDKSKVVNTKELLVFYKQRQTVIGENNHGKLTIYHTLDSLSSQNMGMIRDYKVGKNVKEVVYKKSVPNLLKLNSRFLLIVDEVGVYKINELKNPIVLLRNSPKINLERLLVTLTPKLVIADASNYKNQVLRWEQVAKKKKVPFQSIFKEGAVILE